MQNNGNRLIHESSPYLRQHADNPVDWYPWGEEAFKEARAGNKPILLSIGYSACHWCHVMENESFSDSATAELMNSLFVNIKVDREERPDVDQLYMKFVQMYTGSGGWPLTVFLTPKLEPFYGGTYFPPEDRYGRPGFKKLLKLVADYYHNNEEQLKDNLSKIRRAFDETLRESRPGALPDEKVFEASVESLSRHYEPRFGGIGQAPKFPAVQAMQLFLRQYKNTGDKRYLEMVTHTLGNMARGGIYDQLGGGFARYSVDEMWLVPHFEKMLYDNAQLTVLYLDAYQVTKDPQYKDIVSGILQFVQRELLSPQGGFYSSLNADSEGREGKFYIWDKQQVMDVLGGEAGTVFCSYYGITDAGNFEGSNILHITDQVENLAQKYQLSKEKVLEVLATGRKKLLAERSKRIRPSLDNKVILSWNGLMLSAFSRAYQVLHKDAYAEIIRANIAYIEQNLTSEGRLLHTSGKNIPAYLDDYAFYIQGLLDAYQAVFDPDYLRRALELTEAANRIFWDSEQQGYFYSSTDHGGLIYRMKDEGDQSVPSGSGIMLMNQLRLFSWTEEKDLVKTAESILAKYGAAFPSNPYGYASFLQGLDFYLRKADEVLVVDAQAQQTEQLLHVIFSTFRPNAVVTLFNPERRPQFLNTVFEGKKARDGQSTAYVCHNFSCSLPVTSPDELQALLDRE